MTYVKPTKSDILNKVELSDFVTHPNGHYQVITPNVNRFVDANGATTIFDNSSAPSVTNGSKRFGRRSQSTWGLAYDNGNGTASQILQDSTNSQTAHLLAAEAVKVVALHYIMKM